MLQDVQYAFFPGRQTEKQLFNFVIKTMFTVYREEKVIGYLVISFQSNGVPPVGAMLHFSPHFRSASITVKTRKTTEVFEGCQKPQGE